MKKLLCILTLLMLTAAPASAEPRNLEVKVNGLVCDFCARAIEKVFGKRDDVNSVKVDLDTKLISLSLKEESKLSHEEISSLIKDSGYDVVEIKEQGAKP